VPPRGRPGGRLLEVKEKGKKSLGRDSRKVRQTRGKHQERTEKESGEMICDNSEPEMFRDS